MRTGWPKQLEGGSTTEKESRLRVRRLSEGHLAINPNPAASSSGVPH
jgi:hypothetical protein